MGLMRQDRAQRARAVVAAVLAAGMTAGCVPSTAPGLDPLPQPAVPVTRPGVPPVLPPAQAAQNFVSVVQRVEPVAEAICRERSRGRMNCDIEIVIDKRPNLPPNAFQTEDNLGRPVVGFTLSLIADARNADEIAFVLGHEAAHHISGHLPRQQQTATTGALLGTLLGQATGADPAALQQLQELGATVGARRFSKEFELEADALGAEIAFRAGYDPVRGAGFFARLPDPGDQFLGSHPPNAQRQAQVAAVVAQLRRSY
ncbi:M48 family metallopeptidase [Gemmobacter denitrificans]|uniref:M48 family metallopeptidase n=1 Tax=Gemmobacter denitrificans TaxID=3123040 RepID=A0ABU8BRM8_9RHOB